MTKDEAKKLHREQLICYLFIARDTLVSVKQALFKSPDEENLKMIYNEESNNYEVLLGEIYRRMKKWKNYMLIKKNS